MKAVTTRLFAAILLVPAFAAATIIVGSSDGGIVPYYQRSSDDVDVIVEFRDPPIFSSASRSKNETTTAAALRAFDVRFSQFENDLRAIAADGRITQRFERVFAGASVTASAESVARMQQLPYVARVYLDGTKRALRDDSVNRIGANQVWTSFGTRGRGVVVAVIDTGIDYTHPALGGSFGSRGRVVGGYDFVNKDNDPMDDNGHGTHVAGIIGANGGGLIGVAPDVTFLAYKVLGADGSGSDSNVMSGIERAVDPNQDGDPSDHADVVNMSLGGPGQPDDPVSVAVENAVNAGVVFAVASGNSGGSFSVSAPANAPSAIAVGASDINDRIAFFSSAGPSGDDQTIKPEVLAPGINILSAAPGGGTIEHSGTSMAAPHIAGVAALLNAIHPTWTPQQIKSAIVSTAEFLDLDVMQQGGGRVNALRAASAQVLPLPATIAFGRVDAAQKIWTSSATVDLMNASDSTVTLTATSTGTRDGVDITITPSTMTLEPEQTQTVTVTAAVNNAAVPYPNSAFSSVGGQIVFSGGESPVHVPWALVKAARVEVQYDGGDELMMMVAGIGGVPTTRNVSARPGQSTVRAFVPPGKYLVQLIAVPFGDPARIIFAPDGDIGGDVTYKFSRKTAPHAIDDSATDPAGRLLAQIGVKPGSCMDHIVIHYPAGTPLGFTEIGSFTERGSPFRFFTSDVPDGVSIGGSQVCNDGISSVYVAQFAPIAPRGDVTRLVDLSVWRSVPLKLSVPVAVTNPVALFGSSLLLPSAAGIGLISFQEVNPLPVSGSGWSGTLFITPEEDGAVFRAGALQLVSDIGAFHGYPVISPLPMRNRAGAIVLSSDVVPRPDAYIAHTGETLAFGDGAAHPEAAIVAASSMLTLQSSWIGALDEHLGFEDVASKIVVRNSDGAVVAPGTPLPAPGKYRADISAGATTLIANFDSSLEDASPPMLRGMRVLDSESMETSVIPARTPATLHFAAVDAGFTRLVAESRTTVSWRPHDAMEWLQLPVIVEAEDFGSFDQLGHIPAGSMFTSDLWRVTSSTVGPVDVRVHVEDVSGNSIDYTAPSAFVVVANGRRRAAR
ncbi:MAG: S8 family peptidase [Thermoanaerobaculia bacterium]